MVALWGSIKIEKSVAAFLHRLTARTQLADQFRADVGMTVAVPTHAASYQACPSCLILQQPHGKTIVYHWQARSLNRIEIVGDKSIHQIISVGPESAVVEFDTKGTNRRLVAVRLSESQGLGEINRQLEIVGALGGDLR
jgi:hypothetical protein